MPPRPPLDEVLALFQASVAAEGVTTGPGAAAGNSIVDAALKGFGANSFLSMLAVVYPGQPRLVDSMDITAFNNATGEVTFDRAYKGVAAAIPAGVPYKIVPFRFVPAEVAALTALVTAEAAAFTALVGRVLCVMDFWSDLREEVAVTGAQSTIALSPVTIADLPAGATIVRAIALFKFRVVENIFAGVNRLDAAAALPIQVDDGAATGYVTAIDFVDDAFTLAASIREGGDIIIGDNNIAARVDGNDTYPFRWLNAKADQNNIQFNDVQVGLRIWYRI